MHGALRARFTESTRRTERDKLQARRNPDYLHNLYALT
jgi:hypothetical protein